MIDVLIPVLARPVNAEPVLDSVREASKYVARVLFICSESDTAEVMELQRIGADYVSVPWKPAGGDYARKMNLGYEMTDSPFVLLGADDLVFERYWDVIALRVAEETGAGVVATNDLENPEVKKGTFGTHCLVRRDYVEEVGGSLDGPGHLLSDAYDHNFVDRELCHLADQRGLYAFAPDSHVRHLHPHWGTAKMDATYRKGLAHFREDRRLFLRRMNGLAT